MSVHQVCVLCRPLGRGDHQLCLNMDACPQDTRNLSRDRSDLQARGTLSELTRCLPWRYSHHLFKLGMGLHIPRDCGILQVETFCVRTAILTGSGCHYISTA